LGATATTGSLYVRARPARKSASWAGWTADGATSIRAIGLALVLAGCATAGAPHREFEIRPAADATPRLSPGPDEVELLAAITSVMTQRLGIALPPSTRAYVLREPGAAGGRAGPSRGHTSEAAWAQGRFAGAVASGSGIFIRGDLLSAMLLAGRTGLLAHELAHIGQRHAARGGRSGAAQWIREGHADWVKSQVLDVLGLAPFGDSRDVVLRSVRQSSTSIRFFPDLEALAKNGDWVSARNRLGSAATYGQAFLAVDWLIERYGNAALLDFFATFGGDGADGHWRAVYPIPYRQFIDEFRARLEALR
jgi:hypothetical protein